MQVIGLVVTDTGCSGEKEEPEPPPLRSPGGVDQVPGRLRLSEGLRVAPPPPALADFGLAQVGEAGHRRTPYSHRGISLPFFEGEAPS